MGSLKLKANLSNKLYLFTQALWTESFYFEDKLTNRPNLYIRNEHYFPKANSVANTLMVGGGVGYNIYQKKKAFYIRGTWGNATSKVKKVSLWVGYSCDL
jgi:hypothetical protein